MASLALACGGQGLLRSVVKECLKTAPAASAAEGLQLLRPTAAILLKGMSSALDREACTGFCSKYADLLEDIPAGADPAAMEQDKLGKRQQVDGCVGSCSHMHIAVQRTSGRLAEERASCLAFERRAGLSMHTMACLQALLSLP
jgi:hypothetical protein